MILMLVLIVQLIYLTYQSCTQLNYQTCMKNTPNHSCVFLDNRCYQSSEQNFGCANSLNKNLCLIQNAQCQYIQKCLSIEQTTLDRIGCESRQLTKEACLHITFNRCIYIQEELRCKQYLSPPTIEERCETQYNVNGIFMIVSPLICSQIQDKACTWNPSNYLCTSEISRDARCDDLGLSRLACRQIITDGQNCIYSKQNKYCKDDYCPFNCQNNFLDQCDENMNQHACLSVQSEACQFLDGKCQKIYPISCINTKVNEKTCTMVESGLCKYNPKTLSCEVPSLLFIGCDAYGLNQQACVQLSEMCIFDGKCRTVDQSELFNIQCSDAVSKKTCLSIQTQLQNCLWNSQINECQELTITKQISCASLKAVNGNSCKSVTQESCKYQKENCITADPSDQCETPFINLIGCTSILKFQTPCFWLNNQCTRAAVTSDRSCESYTFVNPIVCSLYYKTIEDSNFICYIDDKFTQFDYTCRYDSTIMSCRSLRKEEFTTLTCGDKTLGLNFYACSMIQTLGQVCLFRQSICMQMNANQQYQIQCDIIQGNPSSCAYTTYGKSACKFNLQICGCLKTIDRKRDKCDTIGVNSIGCGLITQEQCYYNNNTAQFSCLPKKDDTITNKLSCVANYPNQKLCLAITTPGQLCSWSFIKQMCEDILIDPSQPCAYYTNVNQNVCTQIRQTESSSNNKGYCYYDPISSSCKPWTQDRKCNQSCCEEQIGINIHVCSAMTNSDGSYCYFDSYRCRKYEAINQLDIQKIFLKFSHNYTCEQFNFKLCGLINPSLNEQFYCYQSSITDRCQTLLPNIYNQMNKSVFLAPTVRSNLQTCIKINQDNIKVRYDPTKGKCESITETITCKQYYVNKQACLELTKESTCYWDEINFQCKETSRLDSSLIETSIINKNACLNITENAYLNFTAKRFNNILFKCENFQITSTTQCTSLSGNYSYNEHACKQIDDGTKCSYDSTNRSCKLQTEIIPNCDLVGQNMQSCLGNTLGICKWNQSEYKCMNTTIINNDTDISTKCDENLNKFACMKIAKYNCYFDTQLSKCLPLTEINITEIITCDELVKQSKLLLRYFNQRACVSLQNNERCAYDIKNFQCVNFTNDKIKLFSNYTCTQFPMNKHLCLSHTQGSYCRYDQENHLCSNFDYVQQNNCSVINATNLNRDVCIGSTESCTFFLTSSTCEKFEYAGQFCSQLKAEGGQLFGAQTCSKVNKNIQYDFSSIEPIVCFSYQCNIEYYCTYNAQEQGCQIIRYLEEDRKKNENGQNICQIKKRFLECDINFNEFVCLHLTDVPCYFKKLNSQCLKLDDSNNKIATCEQVSAAGCTYVETVGQFCYIQTKQFEPIACNSGMPTYRICSSNFSELPNIPIPGTFGENLDYYNHKQSEYFFVGKIQVNANKCSILCDICNQSEQSTIRNCSECGVIFNEEIRQCISFNDKLPCDTPGMSQYLCKLYNDNCIYQNQRCESKNSNTNQGTKNCNDTKLYPVEGNLLTKQKECISNVECAFIREDKFASQTYQKNNQTACDKCESDASNQQTIDLRDCNYVRNQQNCGSYFTSVNQCSNDYCRITVTITEITINGTTQTQVNCDSTHSNQFYVNCSCLNDDLQKCKENSQTKYDSAIKNCSQSGSEPCKQYILPCVQYQNKTDYIEMQNNYSIVPKQYCLGINNTAVIYRQSTNLCQQIYSHQTNCSNLNYVSCVKFTNYTNPEGDPLYCGWKDGQCNRIQQNEVQLYKKCEYVNEHSCPWINAICKFENNICKQQSDQRCTNSYITRQLVCQQLQQDQCVYENGVCQSIKDIRQQYACSQPGLNINACLINTNQICKFDNQEQKCTITDFSQQECEGLNVKGCTENPKIPCMWDWSKTQCQKITPEHSCEHFISTMPDDYSVNYKTCLEIQSACIYKDKKCQTPAKEEGCSSQIYNKLGCTQKTNQFCQAIVDDNNVFCVEIGDFNQQCDSSFNYYACMKMLGCIWKDGACETVSQDTFSTQYPANPYICQNLKQKGTYFYNKVNSKCELATQQIYSCTEPYINQETCLQLTNGFCYYLTNENLVDYKDTTQRCLNYDKSLIFTQTCQENLNYKVCANVVNSACAFKDGKCQISLNLSCLQLSQQGVYASKQACSQTQDGFCSYDEINQRCKVVDFQTKLCDIQKPCLCDSQGVNEQLCLSINAFQNKCEFKTESVLGQTISYCVYATQSSYKCSDNISKNQCILIGNCKYQNQCSQLENKDLLTCLKSYEVSGSACTSALDVPCGYDLNFNKCMINPLDEISNLQYFNKLACILSSIQQNLIFLNGQCQIAEQALKCDDDINLFACTHIDRGQECIFDQKCQFAQLRECEKSLNVNNPISCSKVISGPCKFKDYNCVVAIDDVSECQYQGFNNLACIMPNLMTCQNCAQQLSNSQCKDIKSKSICLSLNSQCQWVTNQCIGFNVQQQNCESLPVGVNIYTCYSVNMDNSIDQVCVHNKNMDKCIQQEVQQCQNLNSQKTCILNTKLSCIWQNNKCLQQTPLKNQDYCTSYLGSNKFCQQIERFDASCELIQGVCQEAQYKQENWEKFVNRKGCLQQKLKYCYWLNKCICYNGQMLGEQQQQLNCSQDLSFLMCLSIKTSGQYCQYQYGQCNQLILPQSLKWNQYQLVNQNVCTRVEQYPVGYNQEKYSCKILKKIDDCSFPGLNIISCLSDILDYPCMWLNEKCQHILAQRLLQQSYGKINAAYCYDSKDPVYYDGQSCQRVNEFTKCEAQGLSKAGCLSILSEPCRWISDDEGCIKDYPYNQCELNVGMVNAVFCKYVEIGQCQYDAATNSCKIAKFDTWIYSFEEQKCICKTQNCDFNKIAQECILPSNQGINSFACTSIQGAIFSNYECQFVNTNSNCPKLVSANILACKYVNDDCVYDPIEENCTSVQYNGVCEDISISQIGCQQNNCHYFNNQCTCKQLAYVKCLTYSPLECENNNLCYWDEGKCNISQCQGLTDNCQSQVNCYRKLRKGKQVCEYANSCEEVQLDSNIYSTCTEIFIDNKPCYPNSLLNSTSSCVTLKCEQFNNPVYCTSTIIGKIKISDYCFYINQCLPIGCNDIQNEESCNQQNGCYYVQNKENQKICQQFKTCESITTDYVNITAQFICNKMEVKVNENYNHCEWMEDRCVLNPCQYLGIDQKICNGAHINNKYVCALDLNSLTCNVCEVYQKGCDCLNNDQYCSWNTNKQICQSIPCIKIVGKQNCLNRQDCQFEKTCLAKCSYHLNQQYCGENQCYWDSYNSQCAECDIKFCQDSSCQNTKCCQMRQMIYKGINYDVCYPKCEKIVQSQCNYQCSWRIDQEMCVFNDELNEINGNQ
ncbi:hypothetical protein pb186bvf_018514 [Paramecium bursaria]